MTKQILPLILKSALLQGKIAAVNAQRSPDTLLALRLHALRLKIQKRINLIVQALDAPGRLKPVPVPVRADGARAQMRAFRTIH